ncbi:NosD domain-containing protein [Neorhizobium sp. DT-125]|uniref:NosD domain-containing protein n=1 Tax=Neorhizobium sp. DT-125 TaxID=3396163 RepID=UPI003F1C4793
MMRIVAGALVAGLSAAAAIAVSHPVRAEARACSADIYSALRKPAPEKTKPVEIACDLSLAKTDAVTRPIAFSGSAASGVTLDCNGGTLDGTVAKGRTILIRSLRRADGSWDAPRGIRIRNCTIRGDVRIEGLGSNGQAEGVRLSSLEAGHTGRAQAAAPSGITLQNITFVADGGIPLYAAPGVTEMTVGNSRFTGSTNGTAIYLDAESARNRIIGNMFDIRTARREMIAIDGSADNRIEGNLFENPIKGGIFVYRNCGEGGTIRHQKPEHNVITGNTFRYANFWAARPAVWLGSRQAASSYCFSRPDRPFGSSLSPYDYAQYNTVTGNRLPGGRPSLIVDHDEHNTVSDNR